MSTNTINGFYGSSHHPCTIYTLRNYDGSVWYTVDDSLNVNCTYDDIGEGVDIETIEDIDFFTAGEPICSETELTYQVNL